jgi:peptidoglycan/LPS O-acetylase OafA/YrhL
VLVGLVGVVMGTPARSSRGRNLQAVLLGVALLGGVVAGLGEHMWPAWLCTLVTLPAAGVALSSGHERDPG